MTKNLIYILNSYSDQESSHFHHVINLLDEMSKNDVKVTLVIEKASSKPVFQNKDINVLCLKKSGLGRLLELFILLKKLISQGRSSLYIRITSTSAIIASLASLNSSSKVYFWQSGTTHEWDWSQPNNLHKLKWYLKSYLPSYFARKLVDRFVTGPEYMADYYSNVVGVNSNKIRVLYNDVELERFTKTNEAISKYKDKFYENLPHAKGKKIILLVHKMSPVRKTLKYIPIGLEGAIDKFSDLFFVIVGGGSELPELKDSVRKKGLESDFCFMGEIPNKEIQELYCIADIFIHPTYNEGFPRVMLEAMAAGLPFVSTDAGGVYDITPPDMHKFISSRDSVSGFSENLIKMIDEEENWGEYSLIVQRYVQRFSTHQVAKMYSEVLFDE